MMASILGHLDRLADEHPEKLLYSYLDVNGDSLESYTYASFHRRVQAIAGHLWKERRFAAGDRLLLAYPPGLEMICAFFGCVRAGLIPVPVYPPSSRGFQSALYKMVHIAKDCQAAGILTSRTIRHPSRRISPEVEFRRVELTSITFPLCRGSRPKISWIRFRTGRLPILRRSCFSSTPRVRPWSPRA